MYGDRWMDRKQSDDWDSSGYAHDDEYIQPYMHRDRRDLASGLSHGHSYSNYSRQANGND